MHYYGIAVDFVMYFIYWSLSEIKGNDIHILGYFVLCVITSVCSWND